MTKLNTRGIFLLTVAVLIIAMAAAICCISVGNTAYAAEKDVNFWEEVPNIPRWKYGEYKSTDNVPTAKAHYGNETLQFQFYREGDEENKKATMDEFRDADDFNRIPVGNYVLNAIVPETDTYTGLNAKVKFKVLPANNYWSTVPNIVPWNYGSYNASINAVKGNPQYGTAVYSIVNENNEIVYNKEINKLAEAKPGMYTLRASVAETANYTGLGNLEIKFAIAESLVKWSVVPNIQGWVAGDTPNEPVGDAINSNGLPIEYLYKKESAPDRDAVALKPTEPGNYEMIATVNAGRVDALTARVKFKVLSRETLKTNEWKVLPRIEGWTEGETPSEPTGEPKNGTVSFTYKDSEGELLGAGRPTTAGEYILVATAFAEYYEKLENEYAFKIEAAVAEEPKTNSWKLVPNIQGWTKGDVASTPVGIANAGNVTFSYKNVSNNEITQSVPTEIGEYVLIATATENGYSDMTAEVSFRITAPVTLEEHDNSAWLIALVIVCVIAVLLCAGYIAIVIILQKRGISLFSHKAHKAAEESDEKEE